MTINRNSKKISDYLYNKSIRRIAIYGMGILGRQLYEELKISDIEVCFVIDKREIEEIAIPVFKPEENFPVVDRGYRLHPSGSRVPSVYHAPKDNQRGDDPGDCHQPGDFCGDGHGDAAHCKKGACHVGQSGKRRADVPAICRKENHKAFGIKRGYGL